MDKEQTQIKQKVKKKLADFLGIEPDDIEDDFSLTEDLHMQPAEITDFTQILSDMGFYTEKLDFSEIETFSDLIEAIALH